MTGRWQTRAAIACALWLMAIPARSAAQPDPQRAFDFEFGSWSVQISRLASPLSGAKEWVDYAGTSSVQPWWGGRANVGELRVEGPAGRIDGMSVRLYEPATRQWTIRWSNARTGELGEPMVGGFHDGVGTFYNQERFNGRAVLVRFIFSDVSPASFRLEQAFSPDGGRTWEPNWVARFTRDDGGGDAAAIGKIWAEVDAAWNARDAARFSSLYTEDASFEFVDQGQRIEGRAAIRRHFEAQFPRTGAELSHHTRIRATRLIATGVVEADGVVQIMRAAAEGTGPAVVVRTFAIYAVMVRSSDLWRIGALRIFQMPKPTQ
jgi:uncharacterized protein (TIGR02246 family)